jgi:hypothetical protein
MGYSVRGLYKDRLEAAVPLRTSILPRAVACSVYNLPANERRGVFRASGGRADVYSLPAAGRSAVRDYHRFSLESDHRGRTVSIIDDREKTFLGIWVLRSKAGDIDALVKMTG